MTLKRTRIIFIALAGLALVVGTGWLRLSTSPAKGEKSKFAGASAASISNLPNLLALRPEALSGVDIARMNLLCAEGLPGAEGLDVDRSLTALDGMAARVHSETERHLYRFRQNPAEFENSEGFFRMIMMGVADRLPAS